MPYFIFISGGVISGLGKGITASSLALLLEEAGYSTTIAKADPYLNVDAGTMNPIIHGETFVTEDRLETDQDIGHYERFLNRNLSKSNYMTLGQLFLTVLQNEREMKYQGECVEMIRHIPQEIKKRLHHLAKESDAEIVILEIGGTVGDIQNQLFIEAARQLKLQYPGKVLVIHVAYMPLPHNLGELKTKPVQQSVSLLLAAGVQPDIIVTRSEKNIDAVRKEKIAVFCNVYKEDIISNPDVPSVYQVPHDLEKQGLVERVKEKLGLPVKKENATLKKEWSHFADKTKITVKKARIGIVGKYFTSGEYELEDSYVCVIESLKHAFYFHNSAPDISWISSEQIEKEGTDALRRFDGLIVPQGWGNRGTEGMIKTITFARENSIPFLGLCFGMQMAAIEFARNVVKLDGANSVEVNEHTKNPIIHVMPHQVEYLKNNQYGGTIRLGAWPTILKEGTRLFNLYKEYKNNQYSLPKVEERHRHRYEFNPHYLSLFEKKGMVMSGMSPDGKLVEAIELTDHPFFIGVQYHPELKSRPLSPHPIFIGFIKAAIVRNKIG